MVTRATDVSRREDVRRAGRGRAVDEFGRLDVLVSNAGISKIGPVADGDVDGWSAMIDVNLRGVLYGIAAAMPVFRRQGRGHFVTTVSTAGLKIVPDMAVYAATKNAVRTLMEGLRQESTDGVIRTTAISPGFVRTELDGSIDDPTLRAQIRAQHGRFRSSAGGGGQGRGVRHRTTARRRDRRHHHPPDGAGLAEHPNPAHEKGSLPFGG